VVLGLVDVSVTDPTIENLDYHIFRASLPDGVGVGGEVAGGVPGGPPDHRPLLREAPHLFVSLTRRLEVKNGISGDEEWI
jgi:hypothetical protein